MDEESDDEVIKEDPEDTGLEGVDRTCWELEEPVPDQLVMVDANEEVSEVLAVPEVEVLEADVLTVAAVSVDDVDVLADVAPAVIEMPTVADAPELPTVALKPALNDTSCRRSKRSDCSEYWSSSSRKARGVERLLALRSRCTLAEPLAWRL